MERALELKEAEKGAWISIVVYILLSMIKLFVGSVGNSEALHADGLNNTTDVIVSIAVLIGLKISRKPADENHLYGHYRAESVASLIAAFIMAMVGIKILSDAARSFLYAEYANPDMLTGWTALLCSVIMFLVHTYNRNLADKLHSPSLMAAAEDNKADALVSIGAFVGIIGAIIGMPWLDSLAALIVGLIILKTSFSIFKEATTALTDGFDQEQLCLIKKTVESTNGVLSVKDIRARAHGNKVYVDTTVLVDPKLNVIQSHQITEDIERLTLKEHKNTFVHVHIEPLI
jgi:cation diffusion facilitator family transporter